MADSSSRVWQVTMAEVEIVVDTFHARADNLFNKWNVSRDVLKGLVERCANLLDVLPFGGLQAKDEDAAPLGDLSYLLLVAGNSDEDNPYRKHSAIQVSTPSLNLLTAWTSSPQRGRSPDYSIADSPVGV